VGLFELQAWESVYQTVISVLTTGLKFQYDLLTLGGREGMGGMREELVTLTDAKVRLHELVRDLPERDVLLLRHGRPVAAMISFPKFEALMEKLEDLQDRVAVLESAEEPSDMMVSWEKLKAESQRLGKKDDDL
jgi:prevent-host-death family protein